MAGIKFSQYTKAIEVLEAKETLIALKVAEYPKLNKNDKIRIHKEFYRKAHPQHLNTAQVLTTNELAKRMGLGG